MMKLIAPILAALVCASTKAEAQLSWKLAAAPSAAAPSAAAQWPTEEELRREFDPIWSTWIKDVGASTSMSRFRIEIRELTGPRDVYSARSVWELGKGRVELSPSRPWRASLRHELGHLFLREWRARHCSLDAAQATPIWLDEIESLIWGDDEASLRERSAEVASLSRARQQLSALWPEPERFLASPHDPKWVAAVSRLLLGPPVLQAQLRDQLFEVGSTIEQELGKGSTSPAPSARESRCASVSERARRWRKALLQIGGSESPAQASTGDLEFALMDLWSGQLIETSGESALARRPVASVLKPLLLAAHSEAWPLIKSQATSEWACPQIQAPRNWTAAEALAKSCNGYFLAQSRRLPLELVSNLSWILPDDQERELSLPESIGLIPRVRADLPSVLSLYRALAIHHKPIIDELRETAKSGTLSGLAESAPFAERKWSLKSGTTRDLAGAPDVGWIVGISDAAVFGVRRRGTRPQALAKELEKLWQRWNAQSLWPSASPVETQLFTLVDERKIELRCQGPWSVGGASSSVKRYSPAEVFRPTRLVAGESAVCWQGDWQASVPESKTGNLRRREVRGVVLKFKPTSNTSGTSSAEATPQQQRARRGTHLGLRTSPESYVAEALASELASGPREAQRALARVLAHNLTRGQQQAPRHAVQRLCDSTHCQVFGAGLPTRLHREIAIQALSDPPLPWPGWLEFSKGGSEEWTQSISPSAWAKAWPEALQLDQLTYHRQGQRAMLRPQGAGSRVVAETSCEKLRSALRLRRCPDAVAWSIEERAFIVKGRGEGHDRGMNVEEALQWAREGRSADEILRRSYEPRLN